MKNAKSQYCTYSRIIELSKNYKYGEIQLIISYMCTHEYRIFYLTKNKKDYQKWKFYLDLRSSKIEDGITNFFNVLYVSEFYMPKKKCKNIEKL